MRRSRFILLLTLVLAWLVFAAWQYRSYQRERNLIREALHQQSRSVSAALVGGIRSHRRLGRFFQMQLQGMLEEVVQAPDILAAAVIVGDSQLSLSAGQIERLPSPDRLEEGEAWTPEGYLLVEQCEVLPDLSGAETGGFGGLGGRGRGAREDSVVEDFADGAQIAAVLLLDRRRTDHLLRGSARNHGVATVAAGLVMLGLALAWQTTVGLIEERGRSQLLEEEARHFRELSQSAAGLAHETRNPLGLVRGWAQRFASGEVDPSEQPQRAQAVVEECDRITSRINQFLAFARPCQPNCTDVLLDELLDELLLILEPDLEAQSIQVVRQDDSHRAPLKADRELLRQALFNLLQNAVQFSPADSKIEVRQEAAADGTWKLTVGDRGPGVAAEHQASLFTPYFTTRPTGTGLGLAIVRRIAFAHGWQATWNPRPGGGSLFALEGIHGGKTK